MNNRLNNPLETDFLLETRSYVSRLWQSNRCGQIEGGRDAGKTTAVADAVRFLQKQGKTIHVIPGHHEARPYQFLRDVYAAVTGNQVTFLTPEMPFLHNMVNTAICQHQPGLIVYDVSGPIGEDILQEVVVVLDRFRGQDTVKTGFLIVSFQIRGTPSLFNAKWRSALIKNPLQAHFFTQRLDFCSVLCGFEPRIEEFVNMVDREEKGALDACDTAIEATSGAIGKIEELVSEIQFLRPKGTIGPDVVKKAAGFD